MGPELVVIGWFASAIIKELMAKAVDYVKEQPKWQLGMKDEIRRVEEALPKIQAVVGAAERGQISDSNPEIVSWLWQLKNAVDEAENVLDEIEYFRLEEEVKAGKNNVRATTSRVKRIVRRAVTRDPTLKRLKKVVKGLDRVAADVGPFAALVNAAAQQEQQQTQPEITNSRVTSSFLSVETEVRGREEQREEVIRRLTDESIERHVYILPIIGVGGIGKTTLAQLVYGDDRVNKYFDLKLWVCVSNSFDVATLTRKLIEPASLETLQCVNLDTLQKSLEEKLMYKRFLIVFDDVWNDGDRRSWEQLFAPLRSGKRGSKVLLTSRLIGVAEMMMGTMEPIILKGLEEDAYWSLFKECAFRDQDPANHRNLLSIGEEIVKKLGGSPLAAKTVGGALCSRLDDDHWTSILHSNIWDINQGESDILPVLKLSYQHLPVRLRPCFAFCSIFPQDYRFDKDELVYTWIAAGLVPPPGKGYKRWEDVGEGYLDELVKRGFFELMPSSHEWYIMHDLIHDLAGSISVDECLRLADDDVPKKIPETIRHLSVGTNNPDVLKEVSNLKYLRTLLLSFNGNVAEIDSILKPLTNLRLLSLSGCYLEKLPESVGNLIHLRFLALHDCGIQEVPKSVCKLYHLQVLSLPSFLNPADGLNIPEGMGNLINLRHLGAGPKTIAEVPRIGKLTSLQELNCMHIKKERGYKIVELKNMRELRKLYITNLENVESREEAINSKLSDKAQLKILSLEWGIVRWPCDAVLDEEVLDCLQPHQGLKDLTIKNYQGARSPHWMEGHHLDKLESISLHRCFKWKELPPLGQLRNLKVLHFSLMDAVTQVGRQFYGFHGDEVFPSLKQLVFDKMPEWKEWSAAGVTSQWFPRLRDLSICSCYQLSALPPLPLNLTVLKIHSVGLTTLPGFWGCDNSGMASNSNSCSRRSSLSSLEISGCGSLASLAIGLLQQQDYFTALRRLAIEYCSELVHLPVKGFQGLISLKELVVTLCPKLHVTDMNAKLLPSSLESLKLGEDCGDIERSLPGSLPGLTKLCELQIFSCAAMTSLPSAEVWRGLMALENLIICGCERLMSLEGLEALGSLKRLEIVDCGELVHLPVEGFQGLVSLKELEVRGCPKLHVADMNAKLLPSSLESLKLEEDCGDLERSLPGSLRGLTKLCNLQLRNCVHMMSLPSAEVWRGLTALENLGIYGCERLMSLEGLEALGSLKRLEVLRGYKLVAAASPSSTLATSGDEVSGEGFLFSLDTLVIDHPSLLLVPPVRHLTSTRRLEVQGCLLTSLSDAEQWLYQNCSSLQELHLWECRFLQSLPSNLESLSSLQGFSLVGDPMLQSLPSLPMSLRSLTIHNCHPLLAERYRRDEGPDWPRIAHIPDVRIIS